MKKDAYYFPHFSNARNDAKIIKLRRVMGIEGYGMFFLILEVLREQSEFKLPISALEDLAYEWHTSKEKLYAVVANFELFEIDTSQNIFSAKLVHYLQPYLEKSQRAREAANLRWNKTKEVYAKTDANAIQMQCESECKESKVKESKVKENNEYDFFKTNFEIFWNKYSKKVDKTRCFDKFKKLSKQDITDILQKVDEYVVSTPDVQYRKNPLTYLNNRSWENEIIEKKQLPAAQKQSKTAQMQSVYEELVKEGYITG